MKIIYITKGYVNAQYRKKTRINKSLELDTRKLAIIT